MKRSRRIDLPRMRHLAMQRMPVKPLALAIATVTLLACSSRDPVLIYENVGQCVAENPDLDVECRAAFVEAEQQAKESGPKYASLEDCRAEFGDMCQPQQGPQGQSWFMPALAGFMLGRALDGGGYRSAPLYTSENRNSPAYGRWTGTDGTSYGSNRNRTARVGNDAFKPKPATTRTLSRGGFGSTVAAKSNWGGNRASRGGWGG